MYKQILLGFCIMGIIFSLFTSTAAAMRIGPDKIIKCPNCETNYKQATLLSGNTFGARYWSDGYRNAPMLPTFPVITKCKNCATSFWLDDCKVISGGDFGDDDQYRDLSYVSKLELNELYDAIEKGMGNTQTREVFLRMKYWHNSNHLQRYNKNAFSIDKNNTKLIQNLHRLLEILDEKKSDQRIVKAEIFRELGMHDKSAKMLKYKFPQSYSTMANELRRLNKQLSIEVIEIH